MVATAVNEMAAATQEIAGNADHTAQNSSSEAVGACEHGTGQVDTDQSSIQTLLKKFKSQQTILELEEHGNSSINAILSNIWRIAEQTNPFALNAAIESCTWVSKVVVLRLLPRSSCSEPIANIIQRKRFNKPSNCRR